MRAHINGLASRLDETLADNGRSRDRLRASLSQVRALRPVGGNGG